MNKPFKPYDTDGNFINPDTIAGYNSRGQIIRMPHIPWIPTQPGNVMPQLINAELSTSVLIPTQRGCELPWQIIAEYDTGIILVITIRYSEDIFHLNVAFGPDENIAVTLRGKPLELGKDFHIKRKD